MMFLNWCYHCQKYLTVFLGHNKQYWTVRVRVILTIADMTTWYDLLQIWSKSLPDRWEWCPNIPHSSYKWGTSLVCGLLLGNSIWARKACSQSCYGQKYHFILRFSCCCHDNCLYNRQDRSRICVRSYASFWGQIEPSGVPGFRVRTAAFCFSPHTCLWCLSQCKAWQGSSVSPS